MKAIVNHSYGTADALEFIDVEPPTVGAEQVMVRVHSAAVNPLDWHFLTGTPYVLRLIAGLRRPKQRVRGVDVAGTVEALGADVSGFEVGDRVFGGASGSFAELAAARADRLATIPDGFGFDEAAALPVAAVTALQALRDHARVQPGQSVLINGAAGGVGTYAVQIAKTMGAVVTGVCSTRNVEMVRSLGADHVVDYTRDDFTADGRRYDVIIDNVSSRSIGETRRAMSPTGVLVVIGPPKKGNWIGMFIRPLAAKFRFLISEQRAVTFTAEETADELEALAAMVEAGTLRSVIDRRYPLSETAEAIRHLATGHARGKIIITVIDDTKGAG
jgi:NADPH:quinone reductase-like Zn-dependent oxidoreductase